MTMFAGSEDIERALTLLSEYLDFAETPPVALLVGGGSALSVRGFLTRTTKDIDVIALVGEDTDPQTLERADPFPVYLREAKNRVALDLGLLEDWINPGPTSLLDFGLPPGCVERSLRIQYGTRLVVYFIDRFDQIHLKLYAAVDQGGGRQLTDLIALRPSTGELLKAATWATTHDPSPGFRQGLRSLLTQMGFEDVAAKF